MSIKQNGGTVNNTGTTTGVGYGVEIYGKTGTVTNSGSISATGTYSYGVELLDGGSVTNENLGTISGYGDGVCVAGAAGTVTNKGSIKGNYGVFFKDGGKINNTGTVTGGVVGVEISGNTGTIINSGTISGNGFYEYYSGVRGFGVVFIDGGSVTNQSLGTIYGYSIGVYVGGATGTVVNRGSIKGHDGVSLLDGGTVNNTGSISTGKYGYNGVYCNYATGKVTNGGSITAVTGVELEDGGTVTNEAKGTITGYDTGILVAGTAGTITNAGALTGDEWGIYLADGGTVTNTGTITSTTQSDEGIFLEDGGTVTNSGTITGNTTAIEFLGAGANTLTLKTGSVLNGSVFGSATTGATNALVLEGRGTADNAFTNFDTLSVDAQGTWTLGAASTIVTTTASTGTLSIADALTTALIEDAGAAVTIGKSDTLTLNAASTLKGATKGMGTLAVTAGVTSIDSGATVAVKDWSTLGATAGVTLDENLTYSNVFTAGSGAVLTLGLGSMTLTGTITLFGVTIGGGDGFTNEGSLTQSGEVTLGDTEGDATELTNTAKAIWDMTADRGIALGSSTASSFSNLGLFEKTAGMFVSAVMPAFDNADDVLVSAGTLDFNGAVTGTGTDTIFASATLEFGSTVVDTQTIDFSRSGGTLDLGSPTGFAAVISGFDTVGSNDSVELLGSWSITGYTQTTSTEGTLALADGTKSASLVFDGTYTKSLFDPVVGSANTTITYT